MNHELKHALSLARQQINQQIEEHTAATGVTPDYEHAEFDAAVTEDGRFASLMVAFPDGLICSASIPLDVLQVTVH
jgi:hypothetical protein